MIVLPDHHTLILTPGKCGSTSLHAAFPRSIIGPQGPWRGTLCDYPDAIGKHTMVVPFEYLDWRKIIVTRDADSYLLSLWQQWKWHNPPMSFDEFLVAREIWREQGERSAWFYWFDINDYDPPRDAERLDLCDLTAFVLTLTGVELPMLNQSERQVNAN